MKLLVLLLLIVPTFERPDWCNRKMLDGLRCPECAKQPAQTTVCCSDFVVKVRVISITENDHLEMKVDILRWYYPKEKSERVKTDTIIGSRKGCGTDKCIGDNFRSETVYLLSGLTDNKNQLILTKCSTYCLPVANSTRYQRTLFKKEYRKNCNCKVILFSSNVADKLKDSECFDDASMCTSRHALCVKNENIDGSICDYEAISNKRKTARENCLNQKSSGSTHTDFERTCLQTGLCKGILKKKDQ